MIEIEKKFLLTEAQRARLLKDAKKLEDKKVEDSYFDTSDYRLTTKDYWLRLRNGAYELKAPLAAKSSSRIATNRYHEITDTKEIAKELHLDTSIDLPSALAQAEIKPFMTCFTNRTSYEKQGFHIDIDSASYLDSTFKYSIAEIELLVADEKDADIAEQKVIEFANECRLTTDQIILGKIVAYLQAEKPDHYNALLDANIIK